MTTATTTMTTTTTMMNSTHIFLASNLPFLPSSSSSLSSSFSTTTTNTNTNTNTTTTTSSVTTTTMRFKSNTTTSLPPWTNINTYPAPSVPPALANSPTYRHHSSSLPQNFIFILTGGLLLCGASLVLLWLLAVKWCMERSIRRANREMRKKMTVAAVPAGSGVGVVVGAGASYHRLGELNRDGKAVATRFGSGRGHANGNRGSTGVKGEWVGGGGGRTATATGMGHHSRRTSHLADRQSAFGIHLDPGDAFRNSSYNLNRFYSPTSHAARMSYHAGAGAGAGASAESGGTTFHGYR